MRAPIAGLAAVSTVHLIAQLLGLALLAAITQVLLMPLLALALWRGTRGPRDRLVVLVLVALGFAWIGDVVPRLVGGDAGFLGMLGAFLIAQLVLAGAFWPLRHRSLPAARPMGARAIRAGPDGAGPYRAGPDGAERADGPSAWIRRATLLPYLVVALGIVVLCAPGAGRLLPAVVLYAGAITTMAVLSTGLRRPGGIGGAVFMVSDTLIALEAFEVLTLPHHAVWVMATYITAQVLIVTAVLRTVETGIRGGAPAPGGHGCSSEVSADDPRCAPPGPAPARAAWPAWRRGSPPPAPR